MENATGMPEKKSGEVSKYHFIGKNIRKLRTLAGLTLEQLAEKVGVSYSYISLIEHGKRTPDVALLIELARLFKVKPEVVLDDGGQMQEAVELAEDYLNDVPVGTVLIDRGTIVQANDKAAEFVGFESPERMLGLNIGSLLYPNDADTISAIEKLQSGKAVDITPTMMRTAGGKTAPCGFMGVPIMHEGRQMTRILFWTTAPAEDARKDRAEKLLRQLERMLK